MAQEPTQFGQTDFRPALLKLADAKPEVMLVSITAGLLQMAQQYKQLGLTFTVAGTTFFQDPDVINDPAAEGFVHTQLRIEAPPELAADSRRNTAPTWNSSSASTTMPTQIVLTTLDKLLADRQAGHRREHA